MRVTITSVSEEHPGWSLELDVVKDTTVAELKATLTSPPHGVKINKDTKVLGRLQQGMMVSLSDAAKVKKEMMLHGAGIPTPPVQAPTLPDKAAAPPQQQGKPPQRRQEFPEMALGPGAHAAAKGAHQAAAVAASSAPSKPPQTRSWLRMVQKVWDGGPRGEHQQLTAKNALSLINDLIQVIMQDPVQDRFDALNQHCKTQDQQLEPGYFNLPRVHDFIMLNSALLCGVLGEVMRRWSFGGSPEGYAEMFAAIAGCLADEEVSMALGSFQYLVWLGGQDPASMPGTTKFRPARKQLFRAIPSSIFLAYSNHLALAPLERRRRSGPRSLAFIEMMLREYGKSIGGFWSKPEWTRPRPLVVWVLGATDLVEGALARGRHFEEVAGLLSDQTADKYAGERITLVLIGSVAPEGFPCGRRTRVHVRADFNGIVPPPDLVVFSHTGLGALDEPEVREALQVDAFPFLLSVLGGEVASREGVAPVLAFVSRCEEEACGEQALLEQLGARVVLKPTRNLFSGAAADTHVKYDDHGWVLAVHGSSYSRGQLSGLSLDSVISEGARVAAQRARAIAERDSAHEHLSRNPVVYWGILDLKYDPLLPLEKRVQVLETGDGRSSRFSGYGASIKSSVKQDHREADTLHRAVLVENKKLTHDYFAEGGYGHILPRQLCLERTYTEKLALEIQRGLLLGPSDVCVLKLCNRARGAGCITIRASELDEALRLLLVPPSDVEAWLKEQDAGFARRCSWGCFEEQLRHWWSNECPVFVAEELCMSAPTRKDGRDFDGTMRVGFLLTRVEAIEEETLMTENGPTPVRKSAEEAVHDKNTWLDLRNPLDDAGISWPGGEAPGMLLIEWLGGYWKLPEEDVHSPDLRGRIISKARQGTAPVRGPQLHEVYAALAGSVEFIFSKHNMSPQSLLQQYPEHREFSAFIAARLACSMRMRDANKSNAVLGLAQAANAKCAGLPKGYVDSYIHRNFGVFEALSGRWKQAGAHFKRSLDMMPTNATTHYLAGMCHLESEDWKATVESMEVSLQLDPDFKAPYVNLAVAWLRLKGWSQAIEACEAGLYRHPQTPHFYYNMGLAYYWQAQESEAGGKKNTAVRQQALEAFEAARANLEKSSTMWIESDEQLVHALRSPGRLARPLSWGGWKFFGWRP